MINRYTDQASNKRRDLITCRQISGLQLSGDTTFSMLIRLLLVCALIVVLVFLVQQFQRKSAARQKILKWQLVLGLVALMLIVLAATGRIHWLGAIFATLLAFFRQLIPLLLKWSPAIKQLYQHYQQQNNTTLKRRWWRQIVLVLHILRLVS